MDSPIIIACLVFVGIYLVWFVIRLFADFVLVAIACTSAMLAYNIQSFYPEILMIFTEANLLEIFNLPAEPNEIAIFKLAGLIVACSVLISIPILPFSATYRWMFGVDIPTFYCRKNRIRSLITEEIQRQNQHIQPLDLPPEPLFEQEISEQPIVHLETESIGDKSIEAEPIKDEPIKDEPIEDKPMENKSIEDKPIEDKPIEDKPMEDKPIDASTEVKETSKNI